MYIYVYIYMYMYVHIISTYVYIYIYLFIYNIHTDIYTHTSIIVASSLVLPGSAKMSPLRERVEYCYTIICYCIRSYDKYI